MMLKNDGKRPPVPKGTKFDVVYRDGLRRDREVHDHEYEWTLEESYADIVMYEIVN